MGALTGKAMELTSKIAKIDQDNYPETLEACYIINPPWCAPFACSILASVPMLITKSAAVVGRFRRRLGW